MKTITVTPKNEEVIPLLEQFFSNSDLVSDFQINENNLKSNSELEAALEKVNKQYGNVLRKLAE